MHFPTANRERHPPENLPTGDAGMQVFDLELTGTHDTTTDTSSSSTTNWYTGTGLVAGSEHGCPVRRSNVEPCLPHSISHSSGHTSPSANEYSSWLQRSPTAKYSSAMRTRAIRRPATSNLFACPGSSSLRPHRRAVSDTVDPRPVGQSLADHGSGAGNGHLIGDVGEEPGHNQPFGHLGLHPAGLEVVALVLGNRAHRRRVAAPDVVLLDVEVGNRVRMRPFIEDEVVIGLHGVGPDRSPPHPDQPAVDRMGTIGHGSHEEQVTCRLRRPVILERPKIEHLIVATDVRSPKFARPRGTDQRRVGAEPGIAPAQGDRETVETGVSPNGAHLMGKLPGGRAQRLDADVVQLGTIRCSAWLATDDAPRVGSSANSPPSTSTTISTTEATDEEAPRMTVRGNTASPPAPVITCTTTTGCSIVTPAWTSITTGSAANASLRSTKSVGSVAIDPKSASASSCSVIRPIANASSPASDATVANTPLTVTISPARGPSPSTRARIRSEGGGPWTSVAVRSGETGVWCLSRSRLSIRL